MRILAGLAALALACGAVFGQAKRARRPSRLRRHVRLRVGGARRLQRQPLRQQRATKELDRLEHLSPQQRQQMLDRLPPRRARKLQERFNEYNQLTPEQRGSPEAAIRSIQATSSRAAGSHYGGRSNASTAFPRSAKRLSATSSTPCTLTDTGRREA